MVPDSQIDWSFALQWQGQHLALGLPLGPRRKFQVEISRRFSDQWRRAECFRKALPRTRGTTFAADLRPGSSKARARRTPRERRERSEVLSYAQPDIEGAIPSVDLFFAERPFSPKRVLHPVVEVLFGEASVVKILCLRIVPVSDHDHLRAEGYVRRHSLVVDVSNSQSDSMRR